MLDWLFCGHFNFSSTYLNHSLAFKVVSIFLAASDGKECSSSAKDGSWGTDDGSRVVGLILGLGLLEENSVFSARLLRAQLAMGDTVVAEEAILVEPAGALSAISTLPAIMFWRWPLKERACRGSLTFDKVRWIPCGLALSESWAINGAHEVGATNIGAVTRAEDVARIFSAIAFDEGRIQASCRLCALFRAAMFLIELGVFFAGVSKCECSESQCDKRAHIFDFRF